MEDDWMNELCSKMKKSGIQFDEGQELYSFYEKNRFTLSDIKETNERYQRYLDGISCWQQRGKSYEYVRDNIITYLRIPTNKETLELKLQWMKKIDFQLIEILERKV
jgi:hypothetical protein